MQTVFWLLLNKQATTPATGHGGNPEIAQFLLCGFAALMAVMFVGLGVSDYLSLRRNRK